MLSEERLKSYVASSVACGNPLCEEGCLACDNSRMAEELVARRETERWIPIAERRPTPDQECLILVPTLTMRGMNVEVIHARHYTKGEMFESYEGGHYAMNDITHWRPLPAPPSQQLSQPVYNKAIGPVAQ